MNDLVISLIAIGTLAYGIISAAYFFEDAIRKISGFAALAAWAILIPIWPLVVIIVGVRGLWRLR